MLAAASRAATPKIWRFWTGYYKNSCSTAYRGWHRSLYGVKPPYQIFFEYAGCWLPPVVLPHPRSGDFGPAIIKIAARRLIAAGTVLCMGSSPHTRYFLNTPVAGCRQPYCRHPRSDNFGPAIIKNSRSVAYRGWRRSLWGQTPTEYFLTNAHTGYRRRCYAPAGPASLHALQ